MEQQLFTVGDLRVWAYHKEYLIDILNGEYELEAARENLRGLIVSEFDTRKTNS